MGIAEEMPVLARHIGEWEGTYTYVDRDGNITSKHACYLTHEFPDEHTYFQTNRYTHPDGRVETIAFPSTYKDRNIWFDTERIRGHAWEVDERTVVLTWVYKTNPQEYLYEMIQIDDAGRNRTRTWHWFRAGACYQRTLINETRVK